MLTQRLANIVFAVVIIIACIWFAVLAQGFETSGLLASSGLPSKFFPQLMLGFTTLCAIIVIAQYWRASDVRHTAEKDATDDSSSASDHAGDAIDTVFANGGEARRGLLMLVVAVCCYVIWMYAGFITMAVALGPLSLVAMGVRSVKITLTVLALTAIVYVVFTLLLGVQLP